MVLTEEIKAYFKKLGYDSFIENDKAVSIFDSKVRSGKAINITKADKGVRKEDDLGQALKLFPKEIIGVYNILKRF